MAHAFVERLEEFGVYLYWHQQGIETLLPNGKRNPAAALMFALLAESTYQAFGPVAPYVNFGRRAKGGFGLWKRSGITADMEGAIAQTAAEEGVDIVVRTRPRGAHIWDSGFFSFFGSKPGYVKDTISGPLGLRYWKKHRQIFVSDLDLAAVTYKDGTIVPEEIVDTVIRTKIGSPRNLMGSVQG